MVATVDVDNGIEIDAEFSHLIPAPSAEEYSQLEANLLADGCRDALICWGDILLDGHTRYKICCEHNIPFKVKRMRFEDRNAARNWIINLQLGRRNITPETRAYLIGSLYAEAKPEHGGDRASTQSGHLKSAEKIGSEHGVSPNTVRRAEQFKEAVDGVAEKAGEQVKEAILSRGVKSTKADVEKLADLPPKKAQAAGEKITSGKAKSVGEALEQVGAKPPREPRQPKNGAETGTPAYKREVIKDLGRVQRGLDRLKIHDKCRAAIEHIHKTVKEA